ncbi:endonuclease III [Dictyobacter alpinus]|uniref:Endonuclease III n=1 Tax=Dictyobacter alpinus TaxID=2014873 RepID=A0A402BAL2_9CHLR|nr:endonuclease III [Dictyobacter alpinus]GCE28346.1 endonuclease III [Dictyobacter alpinus]
MTATITPSIHLTRIYDTLIETYGEMHNEPNYDPLGGLIGTILSQHTSDINSGRAYRQLVDTYATWEEVRDAPTNKVADAIRSGGLANVKAPRIQDVLHTLTEQQQDQGGTKALAEFLYDEIQKFTPEEGWKYLQKLPGVGPKTSACVMLFNMNEAIMPIDTHVHRVSKRLGLIGPKVNANQAHTVFAKIAPPDWVYGLHVGMIRHGRQVCHAQRPKCGECPLYQECAYVGSVNAQETGAS